jgi:ankyrin repeat protein
MKTNVLLFLFFLALSLAASGGYVAIIKLLLSYGAEINSRLLFFFVLFIFF